MAMRSMYSGGLGFGLVNVPVKMYAATAGHDNKFNLCHVHDDGDGHRIEMFRRCKECQTEVDYGDLVRGVEREDGTMLLITNDELASVEQETGAGFEVLKFVHADEVDPITFESPYYLTPDVKSRKDALDGYVLLRTVLVESGRVGIVRYTMRGKTHMAVLRVVGNVLVLQNVVWSDELRAPEFPVLNREVKLDPKMVKMAKALVESMAGEYDADEFVDEGTAAVNELIAAKEAGKEIVVREAEAVEDVGDLLAALEASIAKHPAGKKAKARKSA